MSVSIIGPFPTAYTPKSACTAVSSEEIVGIDFATSCLPRSFDTHTSAYYSPGTGCPSGYTAQSRCTRSSGAQTTITCCPVRENIDVTMHCVSDAGALRSVWTDMLCTWSAGSTSTVILVTTVEDGTTHVPAITMFGGDGINAYGLKMIYEASDLSTTAASTKVATTTPTTRATAGSATATSAEGDSSSGGLSTGAKAAIGVIIPVVIIAALLGAFFWYRRRKQRGTPLAASDDEPKELPLNPVMELYGSQQAPPSELAVPVIVSELPGDIPDVPAKSISSPTSGYTSTAVKSSPALSNATVSKADTTSPAISHAAVSTNSPEVNNSTAHS